MRIRAAVSIPFTPYATTKTPRLTATRWVKSASGVEWNPSQNAPGTSVGISPVSVATKKRMVQPMTTL